MSKKLSGYLAFRVYAGIRIDEPNRLANNVWILFIAATLFFLFGKEK